VPATTLRRLRPTCKQWNALLKDQIFTEKHHRKAPKQPLLLMLKEFGVWEPKWITASSRHYKKKSCYALGYKNNKSYRNYKILRASYKREDQIVEFKIYELSSDICRFLDGISLDYYIHGSGWIEKTRILYSYSVLISQERDLDLPPCCGASPLQWIYTFLKNVSHFPGFFTQRGEKVAVCPGQSGWDSKNVVYIIGEDDEYHTEIPYIRSTQKSWQPRSYSINRSHNIFYV
ncbi:hypothetical protein HID58_043316, partial [Brassica napus]